MEVETVLVNLPNLNQRVSYRLPTRVQYPSAEVGDLAHGRRQGFVDHNQVIIRVERKLVWIEGPSVCAGVLYKLRGKCSAALKAAAPRARVDKKLRRLSNRLKPLAALCSFLHHVTEPPRILLFFCWEGRFWRQDRSELPLYITAAYRSAITDFCSDAEWISAARHRTGRLAPSES